MVNRLRNISLMFVLQILTLFCAALLALMGLAVLLGWILGLPYLSSLGTSYVPVAPSTAVLFILNAVMIFLRERLPFNRAAYVAGLSITLAGGLIALVLFVLSYQGIYLDIEHVGLPHVHDAGKIPIGHISPVSAACFMIAFLSYWLLLSSSQESWRANLAWGLACMLTAAGSLLLLAYLFGVPLLYGSSFIPPAALTCIAFIVLGIALMGLSVPHGWLGRYRSNSSIRAGFGYVLLFVLLAVGIVSTGYVSYRNFEAQFRKQANDQLSAVAALKANELVYWRKERLADANFIYENPAFSNLAARYLNDPQDTRAQEEIRSWLNEYETFNQYDRVRLVNTWGASLISIPDGLPSLSPAVLRMISESLRTRKITLVDFYRDEQDQRVYISILIPILNQERSDRVIGFVTLRIDPRIYLYPYLAQWPTDSDSAETLLVRRDGEDVLFLNQIRFNPDSALTLRIPLSRTDTPAVKAALGGIGVAQGVDYRGVSVLADTRPVPDSTWFLVSKMDITEVYAPLKIRLGQTFGMIGVALLALGAGLMAIWRQQRISYYRSQVESAEALQESERLLRESQAVAGLGSYIVDITTGLWKSSEVLDGIFGIDDSYIRSMESWSALIHPDDRAMMNDYFVNEVIGKKIRFDKEYRIFRNNDQAERWVYGLGKLEFDSQGQPLKLVGTIRDVTERKRAEEELRRHLSELKVLYDNGLAISALQEPYKIGAKIIETLSSDLSWHHIAIRLRRGETDDLDLIAFSQSDLDGETTVEMEKHLSAMVGKIGQGLSGWSVQTGRAIRTGNVQEYPQYVDTYSSIRSGMYMPLTIGERVIGSIAVESEEENAFTEQDERLLVTLAAQTAVAFENARLYQNIQWELEERLRMEEKILQLNASLEQRVQERTQELRDAQDQLVRHERLALLGQLAGSVGHELRNPLGVISNAVYFLKVAQPDAGQKIKEYLDIIEKEAHASDKIITDLLDFTRIKSMDRQAASVPQLIHQALKRFPMPESVLVTLDLPEDLPRIYADPQHVVQVLGNLIINAYQSMPKGGKLTVSSYAPHAQEDMICITVQDSGVGISPENIKKLFEPLFTTKTKGIGLGLAVSQKLIEANGGRIEVHSEVGVGSAFCVYLPIYRSE